MTSPEMKACPLCGDKDEFNPSVSTSYKYANPGTASTDLVESGHFVECDKCGCVGPIKPLEEAAIAAWNQRASIDDEVRMLREALWSIALEAHETIPPRGKDAAFATLRTIQGIAFAALKQGETHGAE